MQYRPRKVDYDGTGCPWLECKPRRRRYSALANEANEGCN
jgi:hypothetical protein